MPGPGQVTPLFSSFDGGAIRLSNFDVDQHALKQEHKDGLRQWVLSFLRHGGSARVVGLTSTTGSPEHNLGLSVRRADEVVHALERMLGEKPRIITTTAMGESVAATQGDPDEKENSTWRAVTVFYYRQPDPPEKDEPIYNKPILRYHIVNVLRPKALFLGGGGGDPIGALFILLTRPMLEGHVTLERPKLLPATWMVTRIEYTAGAVKAQPSEWEAQWDTYEFSWGGHARGVIQVWQGQGAKNVAVGKEYKERKIINHISPIRAMELYDKLIRNRGVVSESPLLDLYRTSP